jgi:RNA recognition motif-containing protein
VPTQEPKPENEAQIAKSNLQLRDKTKIFVGNLPLWVKKEEICRFFRQFGPLKKVELIKGHDSPERNVGYLLHTIPNCGPVMHKSPLLFLLLIYDIYVDYWLLVCKHGSWDIRLFS